MFDYPLYRLGQFAALSLPLKASYAIAARIADLRYLFAFRDRREVTGNLKVIFPDYPPKQIRKIRIRVFRNFAKYLVDFFRFPHLDAEFVRKNIIIKNANFLDEVLARNKGVILVSAHLGNWELAALAVALSGYPFWAVALTHKVAKVNDFFNAQRRQKGINIIPLGKAAKKCLQVLAENKILGLMGDRDFSGKEETIDFFGKATRFPHGPAAFCLKTGAGIIPVFIVRNGDNNFIITLEKPIYAPYTRNIREDMRALIFQYKGLMEDYIRRYPEQWFMFRKFWVEEGIG